MSTPGSIASSAPAAPASGSTNSAADPQANGSGATNPGVAVGQKSSPGTPSKEATDQQGKPPKAEPPKLYEVKSNGKTKKYTLEELVSRASLGDAADERFQEGAKLRKQAEALLGRLRDPEEAIRLLEDPSLNLDPEQVRVAFEKWYARKFIDPEKLTPEQKKLQEYQEKLKGYEDQEKEREEKRLSDERESMGSQARERMTKQIIEVLETGKLPKTNFMAKRLVHWMQVNHKNNFQAPTEVLIGQVMKDFNGSLKAMAETSDGETLVRMFGDEVINKIRQYDLDQLKARRAGLGQQQQNTQSSSTTPAPKGDERPTTSDVNSNLRRLARTGRY